MKHLVFFAALSLIGFAAHAAPSANKGATADDENLVYSLAARPIGLVNGKTCEIRGAVWGYGPRAGVKHSLVDVVSGEVFRATTNAAGIYSLSIPYVGVPRVLQERLDEPVYVAREFGDKAEVINGGVVCDHRLRTEISQITQPKETR